MANLTQTAQFLLPDAHNSLFCDYFVPTIAVGLGVLAISLGLGIVGTYKQCYKAFALMATGVVIKLALIPDVGDDISEENRKKIVVFEIDDGTAEKQKYKVGRRCSLLFLPLAVILTLAYVSVIVTASWSVTTQCPDNFYDTSVNSRCYAYITHPPINCTAWNLANMTNELICVPNSASFDPFNPLERFVSLLAVQVTLLQLFACVINKGCCDKCREPPNRYLSILVLDCAYIAVLVAITGVSWPKERDRMETFGKLTIPFLHLLAVSMAESFILVAFVCLLRCSSKKKRNAPTGAKSRTPSSQQHQQTGSSEGSITGSTPDPTVSTPPPQQHQQTGSSEGSITGSTPDPIVSTPPSQQHQQNGSSEGSITGSTPDPTVSTPPSQQHQQTGSSEGSITGSTPDPTVRTPPPSPQQQTGSSRNHQQILSHIA